MPRWHIREQAEDEEDDTSSEEEDEVESGNAEVQEEQDSEAEEDGEEQGVGNVQAESSTARRQAKISIPLGKGKQKQLTCHVCGKKGHNAGFVGSVYVDCPNKPCYLCKQPGHTTMTCPHRIAPEHGCTQASSVHSDNVINTVLSRQHHGRLKEVALPVPRWQVEVAVLKLHSRRCTTLEFHPFKTAWSLCRVAHCTSNTWHSSAGVLP
jgi:DNA damage-binding protein 2